MRKVLDIKSTKRKREIYFGVGVTVLLASVLATYFICQAVDEPFSNSWVSAMGETTVAGSLFGL